MRVVVGENVKDQDSIMEAGFDPLVARLDPGRSSLHSTLNDALMWKHRKLSRTFLYRWMRVSNWGLIPHDGNFLTSLLGFLRWLAALFGNWPALRAVLLGNRVVFPFAFKIISKSLEARSSLNPDIYKPEPNLVIFPSSAHEPLATELLIDCERRGVPTLALIDNWDNLASKTVLWKKPTYMGVWGPQTAQHATHIQKLDANQVFELGTPRFDVYFNTGDRLPQRDLPSPYVLFVGSAMPFDELQALHQIEAALDDAGTQFADLSVIYRPHPWQQKRRSDSLFRPSEYHRTSLDSQIAEHRPAKKAQETFQPSLDYYPRILSNAAVVIGPLTTMLFEASLCHRPVIALSYSDGIHFNTARRYFSHFDGMERVPGFHFCERESDLPALLQTALSDSSSPGKSYSGELDYFLTSKPGTYQERLLKVVQHAINR